MKKQIALFFSMLALAAFVLVNVSYAQSPKTDAKSVKVETATETKADVPCTHGKADVKSHADCPSKAEAAKKECSPAAQKKCGGCPSKAAAKPAEEVPVPKK
ncbi:MAG: hypothetical protein U1C46_03415 [Bacteroidales bacterium]|nr:hypothetical protein [Bacteroidales bacterium]MDZ4203848.1 hypothetical protein [Bacteroidales bacterium]